MTDESDYETRRMNAAESQLHLLAIKARYPERMPVEVRAHDLAAVQAMLDKLWPLDKPRSELPNPYPDSSRLFGVPIIVDECVPRDGFGILERDGTFHWFGCTNLREPG